MQGGFFFLKKIMVGVNSMCGAIAIYTYNLFIDAWITWMSRIIGGHRQSGYGGEADKKGGNKRKAHICFCRTSLFRVRVEHIWHFIPPELTATGIRDSEL